jgi:hypothetical protein
MLKLKILNSSLLILFTVFLYGCIKASSNSVLNIQNLDNKSLPDIKLDSLSGTTYNLPKDFTNRCLIVFGFDHSQKEVMNLWYDKFVDLYKNKKIDCFYKVPVIDNSNMAIRFMARNGMRMASKDDLAKEHTLTLFTDKIVFAEKLSIKELDIATAILFNKDGSIIWQSNKIDNISEIDRLISNE